MLSSSSTDNPTTSCTIITRQFIRGISSLQAKASPLKTPTTCKKRVTPPKNAPNITLKDLTPAQKKQLI